MTTLVTGANGFVGSAVTRALLNAGHRVRALLRPDSDRRNLAGLDIETRHGDLRDHRSLREAVAGCDYLFHVAADYRLWIPDPDAMYQANVEGSAEIIRLATEAGAKKIVYTSSVAACGIRPDRRPADETTPASLADMIGHYKRSKFLAEERVQRLVEERGSPVTIVNPSTPIGPRDIKPTPTGRVIVDTLKKKMPAYVDTGLNIAHVDDVAAGHLLALQKGAVGERYILGGQDLSLRQILQTIADLAGVKAPAVRLPRNLILPVAWLSERLAALTGKEPLATVDGVRMAKKFMYFSSAKAERQLGYQSRPARQAIADAIAWFVDHGYV